MVVLPNFISHVKVDKMIKKGYMVWIATVIVEEAQEEKKGNEVPLVKEYSNIFLKDLS